MLQATHSAIRKGYAPSPFGQLHYRYVAPVEDVRTGLPIVLFGAAPMSSLAFKEMLLALGSDRIAIAFDSPGYGESDLPDAPLHSAMDFAAIFANGLADLGIDRFNAFGDHSGAILALAMGAYAPAQVARIVVAAAPYLIDRDLRAQRAARWPDFTDTDSITAHEQGKWKRYVLSRPPELSLERAMEIYTDALTPGVHANWLFAAAYGADTEQWLTGLKTPVLFLQIDDWLTENNAEIAKIIETPAFKGRNDLNYFAYFVQADQFAKEIRAFCDGTGAPPSEVVTT